MPLAKRIRAAQKSSCQAWLIIPGRNADVELENDASVIELDDGKIYRKPLYLMVKTMVSG